ncbi:putative nucleic acid-binding, OB-fold protein [Tanacetum coccineum]
MAEQTKQQATFTKINQLRPGAFGLNLTVKVVDSKAIQTRGGRNGNQGRNMRLAECLVGDETGVVVFTARNEQVDAMKEGSTVILRNAKIDMYKGSMRLAVDRWGRVESTESADFSANVDCNLSLIEFELITVEE